MASNAKNLAELLNNESTIAVADVADGSITTAKLADDAVTSAKLGDNAVVTANITDSAVTSGKVNPAGLNLGRRNLIINGAMQVRQRHNGSYSQINGKYSFDRFRGNSFDGGATTGKFTVTQSTTAPDNFGYSLLVTSSAATSDASNNIFNIEQLIEGYDTNQLNYGSSSAKTITLSFYVRSSLTGTFGGALKNNARNRNYPFTYTISSANTFERKEITIAGDTTGTWDQNTNGVGLWVSFGLGVGSNYSGSAGAWAAGDKFSATGATSVVGTNGATWYITGVQLEVGSSATDFEHRPYGDELTLCQRYFEHCFDHGYYPSEGINYSYGMILYNGICWANDNIRVQVHFLVRKRTDPTMTAYNVTGLGSGTTANRWRWYPGSWQEMDSATNMAELCNTGCHVNAVDQDAVAGSIYMVAGGWEADAEF